MPIRLPNERDLPFFAANVSDTQGQLVIELRKQRTNENPFFANGVFVTVGVSEHFNDPIALSPHESCSFPISLSGRHRTTLASDPVRSLHHPFPEVHCDLYDTHVTAGTGLREPAKHGLWRNVWSSRNLRWWWNIYASLSQHFEYFVLPAQGV